MIGAELVATIVTVLCSVLGAWIVVKVDIAKIEQKLLALENTNAKGIIATEKLTETLNDLQRILTGMKVEMRYMRREVDEVKSK